LRALLDRIVADRRRGAKSFLEVAGSSALRFCAK
jgi:hypothetical protein